MFDSHIDAQLNRILACEGGGLLTQRALSSIRTNLSGVVDAVTSSTVTALVVEEVADKNPLAAFSADLIPNGQRQEALASLDAKFASGVLELSGPLADALESRLQDVADATIEMLWRLGAHKEQIRAVLADGAEFTRIDDLAMSAGDTHNHGRSVAIVTTDAGTFVYKPRDVRVGAIARELVRRFFGGVVGIPRCVAIADEFGVCEFIRKRRSEGEQAAREFYRNMGGAAAFIKILGVADMHLENITCADDRPHILDLETLMSPEALNEDHARLSPELLAIETRSLYYSGLLPNEHDGRQLSPLVNVADEGCAPVVGGRRVTVREYLGDFEDGYLATYAHALEHREELAAFIQAHAGGLPVRLLLRNSQYYFDTMKKLYHRNALRTPHDRERTGEVLRQILCSNVRPGFVGAAQSEARQLERGDIPYFYVRSDGHDLCADGAVVAQGAFQTAPADHCLAIIGALAEQDAALDVALVKRAIEQYPSRLPADERAESARPTRGTEPLPRQDALDEARELYDRTFELALVPPGEEPQWTYFDEQGYSLKFCDVGLASGIGGIALFACAYALVCEDPGAGGRAATVVDKLAAMLGRRYGYFESKGFAHEHAPSLGESDGLAGIMTALALIRRFTGRADVGLLQGRALHALESIDLARYGAPDRMIGMAGLVSTLCRFEEYRDPGLIGRAAARLLELRTLEHEGHMLWQSFPDKPRPISGAGHGLCGVAEALVAAWRVLGDPAYARAAEDCLRFELKTYDERFGTWPDLRSWPPVGYMHGYCSGAPGIGIMCEHMRAMGYESESLQGCARLAAQACDETPLNARDHLCCGNAAIAEYYLTCGRHAEAGRVLGAMRSRRDAEGDYRYMGYEYHNAATAPLFHGIAGIGYEMLRYAAPDRLPSIL